MKILITFLVIFSSHTAFSSSKQFFTKNFKDRDGCFLIVEIGTNHIIDQYNKKRCQHRFPPMSTFKIPFVVMGFDSGYFKNADQNIKWDGKDRGRKAVNQDQTPKTFIAYSVIWVSRKIIHFLGKETVQKYVNKFNFGNKLVSGDFDQFWLSKGSIKVSAKEQINFLSNLWLNKLQLKAQTLKLTKDATFDKEIAGLKVYGKTGTGCIDDWCMSKPGRQLGWYVGIAESKNKTYAFALNFSDQKPVRGYNGPRAKKIVHQYLEQFASKYFIKF